MFKLTKSQISKIQKDLRNSEQTFEYKGENIQIKGSAIAETHYLTISQNGEIIQGYMGQEDNIGDKFQDIIKTYILEEDVMKCTYDDIIETFKLGEDDMDLFDYAIGEWTLSYEDMDEERIEYFEEELGQVLLLKKGDMYGFVSMDDIFITKNKEYAEKYFDDYINTCISYAQKEEMEYI